jgi:hypothetical protein
MQGDRCDRHAGPRTFGNGLSLELVTMPAPALPAVDQN